MVSLRRIRKVAMAIALKECQVCNGRANDDCDPACRYWALTATAAEVEEEARPDDRTVRYSRLWEGPKHHGVEDGCTAG
jgi:hypothetical protein